MPDHASLSSSRPHATAAVSTGRLEPLGCRAYQTPVSPSFVIYCKYEGVPGLTQGIAVLHSRCHEGQAASKSHSERLSEPVCHVQHRPVVILSETNAGLHVKGGEAAYVQYVRHLDKTSPALEQAKTAGTVEHFARGYQDYLQAPLQVWANDVTWIEHSPSTDSPLWITCRESLIRRSNRTLSNIKTMKRYVRCGDLIQPSL